MSYASHHTKRQFQNLNLQRWKKKKNNGNSKCISGHIPKGSLKVFLIHRRSSVSGIILPAIIFKQKKDPLFAKIFKYLTFSPKFYYGIDFCSVGVFFVVVLNRAISIRIQNISNIPFTSHPVHEYYG